MKYIILLGFIGLACSAEPEINESTHNLATNEYVPRSQNSYSGSTTNRPQFQQASGVQDSEYHQEGPAVVPNEFVPTTRRPYRVTTTRRSQYQSASVTEDPHHEIKQSEHEVTANEYVSTTRRPYRLPTTHRPQYQQAAVTEVQEGEQEYVPTTHRPNRLPATYQQAPAIEEPQYVRRNGIPQYHELEQLKQRPGQRPTYSNTAHNEHFNDVDTDYHEVKPTKEPFEIIEILESDSEHKADGSYNFHYRGADGTFREEAAVIVNPGTDDSYLEVTGSYSFFDTDGKEVVVHYTAGNHGFVPEGNNIHEEVMKAARENSERPAKKDDTDDVDYSENA